MVLKTNACKIKKTLTRIPIYSSHPPDLYVLPPPFDRTASPGTTLTQHPRPHYSAHVCTIHIYINRTHYAQSAIRRIHVFQFAHALPVEHQPVLAVPVERHLRGVVPDGGVLVDIAAVVELLVDDGAALREDTVGVRLPAVVVDGVEDVGVESGSAKPQPL